MANIRTLLRKTFIAEQSMHGVQPANFTTQENELPGEIRNRIYGFVFGAKSLRVFPTRLAVSTCRINMLPEATGLKPANSLKSRDFYAFRQTCHQIADETDYYLFETLDLSNYDELDSNIDRSGSSRAQHTLFEEMMKDRWNHVRHLMIQIEMIQTQMIQTFDMGRVISRVKGYLPRFPLLIESNGHMSYGGIAWPVDARNLTTPTIDDMEAREDEDGEKLLKVLGYYLPGLVDVRCSYERWGWPGDSPCMRRYRITSNGELKWWYTGELFKKLPDEPTKEQWFDTSDGMSGGTSDVDARSTAVSTAQGGG